MKGDIKLQKLRLHNFKGIKDFTFDPAGGDVSVFGDNGTGKTTLADAASWLLFGKDSQNRAEFGIKTLSEDGKPIPGLDHEVEAVLALNGKALTLRKVYAETWTKKRGSATREFTGHTTEHFIDGVPVKKNDYDSQISEIIDEDAFKLLTNPRHFNEVLHWQDRRTLLLKVCGDISDTDVIASDSTLAGLPSILNGRKLEDHRKVIQAKRTEINRELERVPVRIDEATRGLPEPEASKEAVTAALASLKEERTRHAKKLANLEAGGEVAEETKKLREIEAEMLEVEKAHWLETANKTQVAKAELRGLQEEVEDIEADIKNKRLFMATTEDLIAVSQKAIDELRQEWTKESATSFIYDEESDTCPTCGQSLPIEMVQIARDKALADFNTAKAQRLEDISSQGKIAKTANEREANRKATTEKEIAEVEAELSAGITRVTNAEAKVAELEAQEKDYTEDEAYIQLQGKKATSESAIAELRQTLEPEIANQRADIATIDQEIGNAEQTLAQIEQRAVGLKRIDELKGQERALATEYEKLEQELFLTEQFVRAKVQLLEQNINSKFKMAKFKLFNTLVNGGIEEVCETTFLGIPYSSALNNSARINIGLDIINTLSEHFGFVAPIWMDNAEAVTKMLPTNGQQIRLYVSEADKVLRVETMKEAVTV